MKKFVFIVMTLAWLGISLPPTLANEEQGKRHGKYHEKYRMKRARQECNDRGLKPGTEEFRKCMKEHKQAMMEKKRKHREEHKEKMKEKKSK